MVLQIVADFFQSVINSFPDSYRGVVVLLFYTVFIVIYSLFIWKFYRFLSSRDIMQLNLNQYNYSSYPVLEKTLAVILYVIEYLVILPFLVLFWFAILSVFLVLLSKAGDVEQILILSAAIIASIRVTSYISEDLSRDLAKILPFTVLAMFIISADLFDPDLLLSRIVEIPSLFDNVFTFIIFILFVEFVLRIVFLVAQFFISEEDRNENEKKSSKS